MCKYECVYVFFFLLKSPLSAFITHIYTCNKLMCFVFTVKEHHCTTARYCRSPPTTTSTSSPPLPCLSTANVHHSNEFFLLVAIFTSFSYFRYFIFFLFLQHHLLLPPHTYFVAYTRFF